MREYGQIQCSFWSDPDMQELSGDARLLACYLLTGPHSNGLGCYRLPDGYVQADLGWDSERVSKGFIELFRMGFAERCETTFFVLIPKFLRWNPVANANVAKARVKDFECVTKKARIYKRLCASMLEYGNHWGNGFEMVLKGFAKQEQTKKGTREGEGTDPEDSAEPQSVSSPVAICIPIVGDEEGHEVTEANVAEWSQAFPAVDVMQALRNIRQWNLTHRENRKTAKGVERHIVAWLTREQDRGRAAQPGARPASTLLEHNALVMQEFIANGTN